MGEVLWLPTEEQLRDLLVTQLAREPRFVLTLTLTPGRCRCETRFRGEALDFEAGDASDAYGAALLNILQSSG